jgi:hypothetical protein
MLTFAIRWSCKARGAASCFLVEWQAGPAGPSSTELPQEFEHRPYVPKPQSGPGNAASDYSRQRERASRRFIDFFTATIRNRKHPEGICAR